ncbi:uncharacterized protein LOC117316426 [Pecten maximus]|uniref:uncharacterized protein LOC117316426 n=1 Tax=Pecten maximus TaxID=6579 RepID=UPI001458B27C|nr:uncharacterized protein LOC117316426 [Pecten maximus]XP_033726882.1 uncharacterized protein LOC117316426 [Pecten maximus]XP_033726883.1 uncharacterized protein LOC117316426 [Pecten maximus]
MGNRMSTPSYGSNPSRASTENKYLSKAVPSYENYSFPAIKENWIPFPSSETALRHGSPVQNMQLETVRYRCVIIDHHAINFALRENASKLTPEALAMGREAQSLCTNELNCTMQNCELVMYLIHLTIILQAGNCGNGIIMNKRYDGEIEWKFTKRTFTQTVYSGVKWLGGHLLNFFKERLMLGGNNDRQALTY